VDTQPPERRPSLDALLNPRSVAVIGASDDASRIGGRPIHYMRLAGFEGPIYPVNPRYSAVQGIPAYPDIASVEGDVDLAIVALPARLVPETLEACANKGVTSAVVFSAGFAETGADGQAAQARITTIAREHGIRVLGPNCIGLYNADIGFFGTFTSTLEDRFPEPGPIGLVSQSGAYGTHLSLLAAQRGLGVRYWVTTGNESDVDVPEVIDWFADCPDVSVIVAYSEGLANTSTLLRALGKARAHGKPVIFMKVGTTEIGAEAARSHTASLAGSDEVCDAVLRQFGAYRAHSSEEMLDVAYAAGFGVFPKSRCVALMTISGGVGVQMADAAVNAGLDVAPMTDEAQATLKRLLPFGASRNPIDITAQAFNDIGLVSSNLELILDDGRYDSVIAFFSYVASSKSMVEPIFSALRDAKRQHPDCVLVLSIIGPTEIVRRYEEAGCPVFEDPTRAVRAVSALAYLRASFDRPAPVHPETSGLNPPLPAGPFSEHGAGQVLSRAGLPMAEMTLVTTSEQAVEAAVTVGFPVAMKVCSPDVVHKTEIGGVALDVGDTDAVRTTFHRLAQTGRSLTDTGFEGILLGRMAPPGIDMVVGVSRDPSFGPMLMVGFGGTLVEVLRDVSFRLPPIDAEEARRMIGELRGFPILAGTRGASPYDIDALATALVALSTFAAGYGGDLESAEINPLRVLPDGQGVVGLDAVVITRTR